MPWAELLAHALQLGIAPSAFWQLSLAEWNMIARGRGGAHAMPLNRAELDELARQFPDVI